MAGEQTSKYVYVEVAPATPLAPRNRQTYTYRLADQFTDSPAFTRVAVPFGRQKIMGIITDLHAQVNFSYPTKDAQWVSPIQLTDQQVQFARWIAKTRQGGFGFTLRLFFPSAKKVPRLSSPTLEKTTKGKKDTWAEKTIKQLVQKQGVLLEYDTEARVEMLRRLTNKVAKQDCQALIVVPEKWLVNQFEESFREQFGDQAAFMGGSLTPAKEAKIWHGVKQGDVRVVIGTQKALFLPFKDLGLIVVEEESYRTHKLWDAYPRLDNRDAAQYLASIYHAPLLFSGSFPSLALYEKIKSNKALVVKNNPIVIRSQLVSPSMNDRLEKHYLPAQMFGLLKLWRRNKENVLIVHNRRGSWSSAVCRSCHAVMRCPECGVALAVEGTAKAKKLMCRHCGYKTKYPEKCSVCNKGKLTTFGAGAEELSRVLKRSLGIKNVIMVDGHTADRWTKERLEEHLKANPGTIIIGTSIALRLLRSGDINRVILALPERSLLYPDFRSNEQMAILLSRLQQLLPASRPVTVITRYRRLLSEYLDQLWQPLYDQQLKERKLLHYPPLADMVRLTITGKSDSRVRNKAIATREKLEGLHKADVVIRGPFKSFIRRRRGMAEEHLLLLGELSQLVELYDGQPIDVVDVSPARVL